MNKRGKGVDGFLEEGGGTRVTGVAKGQERGAVWQDKRWKRKGSRGAEVVRYKKCRRSKVTGGEERGAQ
jgi:hypothetical protein